MPPSAPGQRPATRAASVVGSGAAAGVACRAAPGVLGEEHFTEGAVWECNSYRTKQGHFDDYMKSLRQSHLPPSQEAKKTGRVLDQKVYVHVPTNPTEPDVVLC